MNQHKSSRGNRGTTLLEILVAIALLLIIFLFITADLIQSSHAENVAATRTESMDAANYLLGVMRTDNAFWNGDWVSGPGTADPCGNTYPPYTDSITSSTPNWHPAPACTPNGSNPGLFPDLANHPGNHKFQYMWNAQIQGADPDVAHITVWVQMAENGNNIYELNSTVTNIHAAATLPGVLPTPPTNPPSICPPPCTSPTPHSPPPTPTPKPTPSSTSTPTPKPTPTPSGTFE